MRAIVLTCGFILLLPMSMESRGSLTMSVTPFVVLSPGPVTVRTTVEANPDNRAIEVAADSPEFFRSSRVSLDGDRGPRVNEFVFRGLPAGRYEVTVTLIGTRGQRAAESRWFWVTGQ